MKKCDDDLRAFGNKYALALKKRFEIEEDMLTLEDNVVKYHSS